MPSYPNERNLVDEILTRLNSISSQDQAITRPMVEVTLKEGLTLKPKRSAEIISVESNDVQSQGGEITGSNIRFVVDQADS